MTNDRDDISSPSQTVACYDEHAEAYDEFQRAVVPQYQMALQMTARSLERYVKPYKRVLDLGCGTGNASLELLSRVPDIQVYLIDGSESMVKVATDKIAKLNKNSLIGTKRADLSQKTWHEGIEPNFDAIISTLVLEHLPFDIYRDVLTSCFRLLRPGGWLFAVEGYDEAGLNAWFFEEMESRRRSFDYKLSDQIASLRSTGEVHYYTTAQRKAGWWSESGFLSVHTIWQYLCIGLMAGKKPDI